VVEIKFCGMTRSEDARQAASLGASYIGVILAEGPRALTNAAAEQVLAAVPTTVARVGVFGALSPEKIATAATRLRLDVAQLHGDPDVRTISRLRQLWRGQVWAVQRVAGSVLADDTSEMFDVADGVVLDTRVVGKLGGTGVVLPWEDLRDRLATMRSRRAKLVLAGGLSAENVARAVDALQPEVIDVSSGVESTVGVKDHERMRAFRDAARAVQMR
jgi:phosphoribosylanthranilate isomerase